MNIKQTDSGYWQVVEILDSGLTLCHNVYSTKRKAQAAIKRLER